MAFMSIREVAEELGVAETTVRRWVRDEGLSTSTINGKLVIDENDVEAFLAEFDAEDSDDESEDEGELDEELDSGLELEEDDDE